jgi:hypothetical protein
MNNPIKVPKDNTLVKPIFKNVYVSFCRHVFFQDIANNILTRNDLKDSYTKKYARPKHVEGMEVQHTLETT